MLHVELELKQGSLQADLTRHVNIFTQVVRFWILMHLRAMRPVLAPERSMLSVQERFHVLNGYSLDVGKIL